MNNREFYHVLVQAIRAGEDVRLMTALDGAHLGKKAFLAGGALTVQDENLCAFWKRVSTTGQGAVLVEHPVRRPRLIVCGGGHIAQPLARIAAILDFDVTVIDDREEFANRERFPTADRILCAPFEAALEQIGGHPNSFYVIITRGHAADRQCLEQILHRPNAYIGMIGSKTKVSVVMQKLREEGFPEELLQRVYAPIGLKIGAQTPAEIAVCIAAQLVEVRRRDGAEGCMDDRMLDLLQNDAQPMVLATIAQKRGSAPRAAGAKMLLDAAGNLLSGTVGGGAGEAQVCAAASNVLSMGRPLLLECSMTNRDAGQDGMVCGGVIQVLLDPLLE